MTNQLFESALGIKAPWYVQGVDFDTAKRQLTIAVDFVAGSRFGYPGLAGEHAVHDTQIKRLRHLNFFQHECYLEVRVPRVRLPDGSVRLVEPEWVGQLDGFTLLFEALVLMLAQQMPFAAVARIVNLSWHRVHAICSRYVELALASANLSDVSSVAIDETSYRRGHEYLTLVADMQARRVVFVTHGRDAKTIESFAAYLGKHHGTPEQVTSVSIDMSPAFVKGVGEHLPNARVTFDKFHIVAHASKALDTVRRQQQKADPELKGMRWTLLKDANKLNLAQLTDLEALLRQYTTKRTARAWLYR
ncbi:ISL3 family transposase, partial [Paraburkholderia sp. LEh10]|uniref:ISL3 family transposase n=1 Tax=Paraburkholderia sp. LEh10 TaxID=2821353 RepID=UPI001AE90DDB